MTLNDKTAFNIKAAREDKNIKQAAFAKLLEMSASAYSRLENGEIQISLNVLHLISEKLNISIAELLELKGTQINNFKDNYIAQTGGSSTLNISLTPDEFQKIYKKIKEEGI
jgi:transcriptional regulator with XRE-family HTH domain